MNGPKVNAALEAHNPTICWNIPCISYAARYGVGTISREDPVLFVRDYSAEPSETIRRTSHRNAMQRKIESELHGDMQTSTEMIDATFKSVVTDLSEIPCRVVVCLPEWS